MTHNLKSVYTCLLYPSIIISLSIDDYKLHTSCISEAERYEKSVYKGPKKNETKGRKLTPQESWMEIIEESISNCPAAIKSHMENLSALDNVPRKERAFRNFASNSLRLRGPNGDAIIVSLWTYLSTTRQEKVKQKEEAKKKEIEAKSESIKEPDTSETIEEANETKPIEKEKAPAKSSNKKKVAKALKKTLKKQASKSLKMKELRKLIQKKLDSEEVNISKEDLKAAIEEAISDNKSIQSEGKLVKLIQ